MGLVVALEDEQSACDLQFPDRDERQRITICEILSCLQWQVVVAGDFSIDVASPRSSSKWGEVTKLHQAFDEMR